MDHGPDPKRPRLGQEANPSWSARPAYPSYTTLPRLPEQQSGQPHQHQHQHQQHQHPPHNHYPRNTESPALPPLLTTPYTNNRSHEADPYPARPSQPPQSPAHPPYQPAYSPRESPGGGGGGGGGGVMKRDPEEHLPHPNNRRQNSTGNAPEQHPVTPHGLPAHGMQAQSPAPPPPSQHPQPPHRPQHQQPIPQQPPPIDDRRQPSFDNGQSGPMFRQQQSYAPPPPPPPPPQTHNHTHIQSPYEQSPTHNMYSTTPYQNSQDYSPYGSTSSTATSKQRPKHQRASQACDRCRHLKAKCDEQKPCKNCKEKNEPCNYKEPIVKQQDKVQTELLEAVTSMSSSFADLKSLISGVDSRLSTRLTNLEEAMRTIAAAIRPGAAQPFPLSFKRELSGSEDTASNGLHESPNSGRGEPIGSPQAPILEPTDKQQATEAAHSATAEHLVISKNAEEPIAPVIIDEDRPDVPPGSPVPAGKPAIPENHTTGAGNLLMWPAIQSLVGHILVQHGIKYPRTYPLTIEENRGLLHLYGRGEGSKKRPSGTEVPNDFGLLTSAYPEDVAPSPSSNNDWGCIDTMDTAPFSPQNLPPTPETKTPSRKTIGGLRFDHDHVWRLVGLSLIHI